MTHGHSIFAPALRAAGRVLIAVAVTTCVLAVLSARLEAQAADGEPRASVGLESLRASLEPDVLHGFERLLQVEGIATEAVGVAGELSDSVRALRAVAAAPRARDAFQYLFEHATPAGRIYAVIGMYVTDREHRHEHVERLRRSLAHVRVRVFEGCEVVQERALTLLRDRRSSDFASDENAARLLGAPWDAEVVGRPRREERPRRSGPRGR